MDENQISSALLAVAIRNADQRTLRAPNHILTVAYTFRCILGLTVNTCVLYTKMPNNVFFTLFVQKVNL